MKSKLKLFWAYYGTEIVCGIILGIMLGFLVYLSVKILHTSVFIILALLAIVSSLISSK